MTPIIIKQILSILASMSLLLSNIQATQNKAPLLKLGKNQSTEKVFGVSTPSNPAFPASLNNFQDGDTINSGDWNAIEQTIGTTTLKVGSGNATTSIQYRLNNSITQLGTATGIVPLTGNLKITSGALNTTQDIAATSSPTFSNLTVTNTATSTENDLTTLRFSDNTVFTTGFMNTGFNVLNASTTNSTGASSTIQKNIYKAITITQVDCSTDGSNITIDADERSSSTPQTYGTGIFNNGSMVCTSTGNSTSTFSNAGMALNVILNFGIISVPNSTTTLRVGIKYKEQ